VSNFLQIGKAMDYIAHRRMIAFWSVMAVLLPLPWLVPACTTAPKSQAHYDNCRVLNVYDGDTMTVSCEGEKVKLRLYCIDAPEMGQKPWGKEARDYLRSITGPTVQLKVKDRDRYGRMVATVFSNGVQINREIVRAGKAVVYDRYCNDQNFFSAENEARERGLGIWSQPGDHQRPWAWR